MMVLWNASIALLFVQSLLFSFVAAFGGIVPEGQRLDYSSRAYVLFSKSLNKMPKYALLIAVVYSGFAAIFKIWFDVILWRIALAALIGAAAIWISARIIYPMHIAQWGDRSVVYKSEFGRKMTRWIPFLCGVAAAYGSIVGIGAALGW